MTPRDIAVVALWIVSTLLGVALTVRWFWRYSHTEALSAVVCTACGGGPGVVLLLESLVRYIERATTGSTLQAFEFPSTLLSCLWFIVGPILLLTGFVKRARRREAPRGTTLVQLTHVVSWGWSTFIGWLFAATV